LDNIQDCFVIVYIVNNRSELHGDNCAMVAKYCRNALSSTDLETELK